MALSSCALLPIGDPLPPYVGIRSDKGVLTVVIQSCLGAIQEVKVTRLDHEGMPTGDPIFSAKPSRANTTLVLADAPTVHTIGRYDAAQPLLIEVVAARAEPVGSWPGTAAAAYPSEPSQVAIDGTADSEGGLFSRPCTTPQSSPTRP